MGYTSFLRLSNMPFFVFIFLNVIPLYFVVYENNTNCEGIFKSPTKMIVYSCDPQCRRRLPTHVIKLMFSQKTIN